MAVKKVEKEASIIQIIQDMVKEGEKEEKIIETLQSLGVEPEKAKRLLLLGQADTFALLRSEISRIVKEDIDKDKPAFVDFINAQAEKAGEGAKQKITKEVLDDVQKYEKAITGQSKSFQQQIADNMKRVTEISDRVRDSLNEVGTRVATVEKDLDEMKVRGLGVRSKLIGMLLLGLGIIFCVAALFLFFSNFQGIVSIDAIIITVVMSLIGITMLFVSTLM